MDAAGSNYSIRDEIREFWSERAATFDNSVGHEIFSEAERRGWHRLFEKHLGRGEGRRALDLACGTAVISHVLSDLGFEVTGADWSEAMLEQARNKAAKRGRSIRFIMRDAENTMEPRESYDVVTNRHLVWTLVDPRACFAEWFEVLKPGGKVLIVDSNMGYKTWVNRLRSGWTKLAGEGETGRNHHLTPAMAERHKRIREQVYFTDAMPAEDVVAMLLDAGFVDPVVDRSLFRIRFEQARRMPFWRALERMTQDRFAICVSKPGKSS